MMISHCFSCRQEFRGLNHDCPKQPPLASAEVIDWEELAAAIEALPLCTCGGVATVATPEGNRCDYHTLPGGVDLPHAAAIRAAQEVHDG